MGIPCFLVEYSDQSFYMLEEGDEWIGPVPESEVPDEWSGWSPAMRLPDGTLVRAHDLQPGAIFDYMKCPTEGVAEAYADRAVNGSYLICVIPSNHHWHIDGTANNCTRPAEKHHCWVRHGEPPNLTVDKEGDTCEAGSGSIQTPEWHGFLRNGELVSV